MAATKVLPSPVFISAILPLVEDDAADELDVEDALAEGALHGLAHRREGLGQEVVERLAAARGAPGTPRSWRCSAASESAAYSGSIRLIRSTSGTIRFSSRSFLEPKILRRTFHIEGTLSHPRKG